jgi:HEAT repeat protein
MPNDAKAVRLAEKALNDDKPDVRSAAAAALGDMKSRTSILKLREALDDKEPSVAPAAAHALRDYPRAVEQSVNRATSSTIAKVKRHFSRLGARKNLSPFSLGACRSS